MPYYAIDGANNKIETLSKEEILTAIENARIGRSLTDYDMAIVSRIREINHDDELRLWIGTQAEYNAIQTKANGVLYIISDDNYKEDIIEALESLQNTTDELTELVNEAIDTEAADIENESLQRAAADLSLDNKINSTKTELQQTVSAEATAREAAVSNEAQARRNADTALQSNINTANSNINSIISRIGASGSTVTVTEIQETELWAWANGKNLSIQYSSQELNDSIVNYDYIDIYVRENDDTFLRPEQLAVQRFKVSEIMNSSWNVQVSYFAHNVYSDYGFDGFYIGLKFRLNVVNCTFAIKNNSNITKEGYLIQKIVGIKHINHKLNISAT